MKFLSLVFLIEAFLANTDLDWFIGNAAFFVKVGKDKSGMPPEFCLFVIGGKEMLVYLIRLETKARICFCVCKGDSHTTRSAQNATNAE